MNPTYLMWHLWTVVALLEPAALGDCQAFAHRCRFAETVHVVGSLDLAEYPTARVITTQELAREGVTSLAEAVAYAPGLAVSPIGDRGEIGLWLRGLDLRRVPVYLDGIPVYIPFDGTLDLQRFLLAGSHALVVNRGVSSLTYGPNALGGTVNLLSRWPASPGEGRVVGGVGDGKRNYGVITAGGRLNGWAVQATAARQRAEDGLGAGTLLQRRSSLSEDSLLALSAGWRDGGKGEGVLTFIRQRGAKGQPPYAGGDPAARIRYWRWPRWDKDSVYLRTRHRLGEIWEVRLRGFYDRFANTLDSYDDETFTTQKRRTSFRSEYDDFTSGGGLELRRNLGWRRTTLAFNHKRDLHREQTWNAAWAYYDDGTTSLAWEEELSFNGGTRVVVGVSGDRQRTTQAAGLKTGSTQAFSALCALFHSLGDSFELHAAAARRTRLPTLKDRYSHRLGFSLPNPGLRPEGATSIESGLRRRWSGVFWEVTGFALEVEDAVESVILPGGLNQLQNVGRVRHTGVEASLQARLLPQVEGGGYLATVHRSRRAGPALPLTGVAPHRAMAFVDVQVARWVRLRLTAEAEGRRRSRTPSGATRELGGFALWHASVRLAMAPPLELQLRADNLADRHYQREEGYPGSGRQLTATLTWQF